MDHMSHVREPLLIFLVSSVRSFLYISRDIYTAIVYTFLYRQNETTHCFISHALLPAVTSAWCGEWMEEGAWGDGEGHQARAIGAERQGWMPKTFQKQNLHYIAFFIFSFFFFILFFYRT